MVFGGMELLQEKIREVKKQKPRVIVVVSSCPAGIIGDHIEQTASFSEENMPIIPIRADGNLAGDYLQGMIMAYTGIARVLIKKGVPQLPDRVNIIFEKVVATNTPENFRVIQGLLQRLGITVHCRYLCETNTEKVKTFLAAPLNLLANKDYMGRMMEQFFREEFGARFFDLPFPIGFSETKEWVTRLAAHFRKEELVADILIDHERMYRQELAQLKPILKGKKLMVITYNHQLDWLLEIALDLEMEIVQVGILNFSQDTTFTTRFQGLFPVLENYDQGERVRDIEKLKPDLLLANYSSSAQGEVLADTIPYCPDVGFFAGLYLARRWAGLFQFKMKEEWRSDEQLFRKYHG
jgi:nitrogenase molybdenum-iron protein alpha/beta subunit